MPDELERNLGPQPIAEILARHNLKPHDLVAVSPKNLTHKMISRACKGRRLTPHIRQRVTDALNHAAQARYTAQDLFTY